MSGAAEFFKYGRGYALYSQGMLSPGRSDMASEEDRLAGAIERDTLQLAQAVGGDMSMGEYAGLHDKVESLHAQYLSGALTEKAYQEQLWKLPDETKRARKQKPPVHFRPTRDPSGHPVQNKKKSWFSFEKLSGLLPGMGKGLPSVSLKDFWPPKQAEDTPVSHSQASTSQQNDAGSPPPATKPNSWLDRTQAFLDVAGAAEPTPFADATNAGISIVRAVSDPRNAGTHLKNAGISVLSAAVPYVGDLAKLTKAGKVAEGLGATRGKGGGMLASVASMFGMGGGSGSSGGAAGDAGDSGGPQAGLKQGTSLLNGFSGALKKMALVLGPMALVAGAAAIGLRTFLRWLENTDKKSRQIIEENRKLAQFDGQMAGAYATLDRDRILRDIERGRELGGSMSRLTGAQSRFEEAKQDLMLPFSKLGTDIQATIMEIKTYVVQAVDFIEPVSELIEKLYEDGKTEKVARSAVEHFARESERRMRQRKL